MSRYHVACAPTRISRGGYDFTLSWNPGRAESRIYFTEVFFRFEARLVRTGAGRYRFTDLPSFLQEVGFYDLWGRDLACRVIVGANPRTRTDVDVLLRTPVRPYTGSIGPANAGRLGGDRPIRYVGTGEHPFIGRMLTPPIAGMRFFKHGGRLTLDEDERGFDCITFAGSLFGAQSHMDKTGRELAQHLEARSVPGIADFSNAKIIERYFENAGSGRSYLLWSGGHVVVVADRTVHEFTPHSATGHRATSILDWVREPSRANLRFSLRADPKMAD